MRNAVGSHVEHRHRLHARHPEHAPPVNHGDEVFDQPGRRAEPPPGVLPERGRETEPSSLVDRRCVVADDERVVRDERAKADGSEGQYLHKDIRQRTSLHSLRVGVVTHFAEQWQLL